jgi:hypothetical protein
MDQVTGTSTLIFKTFNGTIQSAKTCSSGAFQPSLECFKKRKFAGREGEGVKKLILEIFAR